MIIDSIAASHACASNPNPLPPAVVVASRVEADDADGAVGTPVVLAGGHVVYV